MDPKHILMVSTSPDADGDSFGVGALQDVSEHVSWDALEDALRRPRALALLIVVAADTEPRSLAFLRGLAAYQLKCPCLAVVLAQSSAKLLHAAANVDDFVLAPVHADELRSRLDRLLGLRGDEVSTVKRKLAEEACLRNFVTQDRHLLRVLDDLRGMARANVPVLILGETGTGKELCARALHHLSSRKDAPFVPVDCPALPDHLLENELFGHARGAYTDAHQEQKGLVAMARGGTLFLDEVDETMAAVQLLVTRGFVEEVHTGAGPTLFRLSGARRTEIESAVGRRRA